MKVLHLSGALIWGGNEQSMVNSIKELCKHSVQNYIFCFKNSPIESYSKKNNINYFSVEKRGAFSFKLAKQLSKIVKNNKIDVIHIHTSNFVSTFMVADIFFNLKRKVVFSKKGISDSSSFFSRFKYNYKGINKVICVSNAVKKSFSKTLFKKNQHKLIVIYDGITLNETTSEKSITLRKVYNIPNDYLVIGNIANHFLAKDLPTLIKTAHYLVNTLNVKNVHFIQIGGFSRFTDKLKELTSKYDLENFITFTNKIENAKELISQFDIFLMSSVKEGLPLTIYEAFFNHAPVISTIAGGIPEAIEHNKNGLLSPIKDYKNLAENIVKLRNNSSLKNQFTLNSYNILIKKFDASKLAKKTFDLYCNL